MKRKKSEFSRYFPLGNFEGKNRSFPDIFPWEENRYYYIIKFFRLKAAEKILYKNNSARTSAAAASSQGGRVGRKD